MKNIGKLLESFPVSRTDTMMAKHMASKATVTLDLSGKQGLMIEIKMSQPSKGPTGSERPSMNDFDPNPSCAK